MCVCVFVVEMQSISKSQGSELFLLSSGGALPGPPQSVTLHAAGDHRRQLGISSLALPQPHQPGPQPLPGDQ